MDTVRYPPNPHTHTLTQSATTTTRQTPNKIHTNTTISTRAMISTE